MTPETFLDQIKEIEKAYKSDGGSFTYHHYIDELKRIAIKFSGQVEPSVIPKIADRDKKLLTHFLESLRDYERESHSLLGFDERVNEEFVSIYLQNQFSNFTI